ncbi:hypothetical protein KC887_01125 [Candidatus Kaiserbacteria bacterium]|nr:hypothetical protein [Candidatus Kaiserbacteria bacterium]
MTTKPTSDQSRLSALVEIRNDIKKLEGVPDALERLDKHMREIILDYRQKLEEAQATNDARFPPTRIGTEPTAHGNGRNTGATGGAGTPLAARDFAKGYGRVRSISFISGYIDESFL